MTFGKAIKPIPSIAIGIDSEILSFAKFLSIQADFFSMIKNFSKEFFDESGVLSWSVLDASMNSPYRCEIVARPIKKVATEEDAIGLIDAFEYGLSSIGEKAEWPPFFTDYAVKKIKKIGDSIDGKHVSNISLKRMTGKNGKAWKADFSGNMIVNASKLLEAKYEAYDSVEGRLLAIDLYNKTAFRLYMDDDSESLLCNFPPELKQDAINAIEKRVYVYGLVRSRENGKKVTMKVRELEQLSSSFEMPSLHEILRVGGS